MKEYSINGLTLILVGALLAMGFEAVEFVVPKKYYLLTPSEVSELCSAVGQEGE